jgi:Flp pilus assembly pilin Flp
LQLCFFNEKGGVKMLYQAVKRMLTEEEGQGTTEYIIIVSLIAIALIATWILFKDKIKEFIGHIMTDLGEADKGTGG